MCWRQETNPVALHPSKQKPHQPIGEDALPPCQKVSLKSTALLAKTFHMQPPHTFLGCFLPGLTMTQNRPFRDRVGHCWNSPDLTDPNATSNLTCQPLEMELCEKSWGTSLLPQTHISLKQSSSPSRPKAQGQPLP